MDAISKLFSYDTFVELFARFSDFTQLNLLIAIAVIGIYSLLLKQSSNDAELGGLREIFMIALGTLLLFVSYFSEPMLHELNKEHVYSEFFANWGTELVFIFPWLMIKMAHVVAIKPANEMRNSLIFQLFMLLFVISVCLGIVFNIDALSTEQPRLGLILLNIAVEGMTLPTTLLLIVSIELMSYVSNSYNRLSNAERISLPVLITLYILLAMPFIALSYYFDPLTYATIGGLITILVFFEGISTYKIGGMLPFRYVFYITILGIVFYLLSGLSRFDDLINVGFSAELLGALIPLFLITRRERNQEVSISR